MELTDNIIIIHLESLNEDVFFSESYKGNLKSILELKEKGIYFNNVFATSTSTIMAISDFLTGSIMACEKSRSLNEFCVDTKGSIFEETSLNGYSNVFVSYPLLTAEVDMNGIDRIVANNGAAYFYPEYELFKNKIHDVISRDDKFCLYIYDWMGLNEFCADSSLGATFDSRNANRYAHMDGTVEYVLNEVLLSNKSQNTVIVLFGDHGDDLYSSGFNNGFTHAIPPTYSITKVPVIIYNGKRCGICDKLLGYDNIKDILLNRSFENFECIDSRKYVFSRNLFHKQQSTMLEKGYSISDGNYFLKYTPKGYELYYTRYACYRTVNVLDFFELKNGKLKLIKSIERIPAYHLESIIISNSEEFVRKFYELQEKLFTFIEGLGNETVKGWKEKIVYDKDVYHELKWLILKKSFWNRVNILRGDKC